MYQAGEEAVTGENYTNGDGKNHVDGIESTEIENIDPECAPESEMEPIDIEQVQKLQAELPPVDPRAPVGSNKNPIRIIQQGNQYISTQDVESENLEQIIQVLTNQALLEGSKLKPSAIYNKNTNKRIIFRVVKRKRKRKNENEFEVPMKRNSHLPSSQKKRIRKDDADMSEDDPEFIPELPEEEVLPFPIRRKGFSSRPSKPPRHLVKDYKQLGKRHFDSTEESPMDEYSADEEAQKSSNPCDLCDSVFSSKFGLARHRTLKHPKAGAEPPYRAGRFSNAHRRRLKIEEALSRATDDDLIELVAPRLSKLLSPWESLLMRCRPDDEPLPKITNLLVEFLNFSDEAQRFLKAHLVPETAKASKPGPKSVKQQRPGYMSPSEDAVAEPAEQQEAEDEDESCMLCVEKEEQSGFLGVPLGNYMVKQISADLMPAHLKPVFRQQLEKKQEKRVRVASQERFLADVGYEDESPLRNASKRGRGRPPGKRTYVTAERQMELKSAPHREDAAASKQETCAKPEVLQRVHDPTLNDDLLFMAQGGIGHPIPDEWLQSGTYMAVLTESGEASELVMEAATGKLFHKPTGHFVQLAGSVSAGPVEEQVEEEAVEEPIEVEEELEGEPTVVIDESTGQEADVKALFPGVSVVNVSAGVCIVTKANGARFQVEHGGQGITLETLQTVLEMEDQV